MGRRWNWRPIIAATPVGSLRVLCRHSEASVEAVKELLQQGVGLLDGDCTSESELGHQPILPSRASQLPHRALGGLCGD